jgi:hypothetical protein
MTIYLHISSYEYSILGSPSLYLNLHIYEENILFFFISAVVTVQVTAFAPL